MLKLHVIKCSINPPNAPSEVGQHWINTTNGNHYLAKGIASVGDWQLISSSNNVAVSTNDTNADFLNEKISVSIGANTSLALEKSITNPASDEVLNINFDASKVNHASLINVGQNTHEQIDSFISTRQHFLQYSNALAQTTTGTITIVLATDYHSAPGTSFTKSSATEYRANFTGMVEISYTFWGTTASNDRGFQCGILKNGSQLNQTFRRVVGKNTPERSSSASGSFLIHADENDLFSFRMNSLEGDSATIPIDSFLAWIKRV